MNYNLPDFRNSCFIEDSVDKYTKWYILDKCFDLQGKPLLVTRHLYTNKNILNTGICIGFKVITNKENIDEIKIETQLFNNLKHNDIIWFCNNKPHCILENRPFTKHYNNNILNNALLCSINPTRDNIILCPENVYLECYFINSLEIKYQINIFCFPFDTQVSEVNYSLSL
jgi:hypothetical protein